MARNQSFWNIVNGVLGAVAAIVTAATGVYLAMRSEPSPGLPAGVVPAVDVSQPADGTTYDRTPWLGIELRQNDKQVPLRSVGDSWEQFEAKLAPGPFQLTITRQADDPSIGIQAWHDESVFDCVRDDTLYLQGTGIAGAVFAVPILYLDKEGFNYYHTERMKRLADDQYAIYISTIGSGELELPLTRFTGPIHLIVFRVPDGFAREVASRNFERITLRR
jgi:hypothetical protein